MRDDHTGQGVREPDGHVYDAEGRAWPVYDGYVYDDAGNAYPLEQVATNLAEEPAHEQYAETEHVDAGSPWHVLAPEPPAPQDRRTEDAKRRRRSAISLVVALVLLAATGYYVVNTVLPSLRPAPASTVAADDFPGPGSGEVEIVVNPGDTGSAIGRTLEEAGVVASVTAFTRAYAANPDAVAIQHGTYTMLQEMNAADAVERLLNREFKIENRVTIPEGHTVQQILQRLAEETEIPLEEFEAAADKPRKLGVKKPAQKQLEGWLFPATYTIEPNDTAEDILSAMVAQTRTVLARLEVDEDDWEEVLNKASLVEREINRAEDRGKAARVIENRLEEGWTLGIDATLAYGLDKSGLDLTVSDLESDHPYNTRVHAGLPPTPIGSPGEAAIRAVVSPEEGDWMYWVTVNPDTGETVFTETLEEHNEQKKRYDEWFAERQSSD